MIGYLIRRVAQALIVILGVTLLVFILSHIIPGGAARAALGPRALPEAIAQYNRINGYDLPLWDQFYQYVRGLVESFNLGYSYHYNQAVNSLIEERLPKTLLLVGFSTVLALIIAIPLGVLQVVRRNRPVDYALTGAAFIGYSMPAFLIGQLLILYFAIDFKWLSTEAPQGSTVGAILADPRGLVLPVLTLSALTIASFSRYMRSSMMEVMTQDYIRTARAKGASGVRVLFRHGLRNALIPIVTLIGLSLPTIVSGALITETVFNFPGMGLLTTNAALNTDVPVLLGTTFVATLATVAGSLIADILYAVVDPQRQVHLMRNANEIEQLAIPATEHDGLEQADLAAAATPGSPAGGEVTVTGGIGVQILRVFVENKLAVIGVGVIVFFVLFCFLGPVFYSTNQNNAQDALLYSVQNAAPSAGHLLGTDPSGFDMIGRIMYGGQTSLEVGFAAAAIATVIGVVWGAVSGFFGGWVDALMMRIVDVLLSIPLLFLLIVLAVIFKPSLPLLILVIGFVAWLVPARLVRGETLSLRVREYVQAVRVMGGTGRRMIFRHIIPNTIGTIIVNATFQVADAILILASLGFVGLGVPLPLTDWGSMLANGVNYALDGYWWQIYPTGLAIVSVVVAFNFIGDALRDAFEVRLQRR